MTFYFTPFSRNFRRQMMQNMMDADWPVTEREYTIPMDVIAEDDGFKLTAYLPGVKAEDLNIQVVNESVTIQGEFKPSADDKASFILQELPTGKFYRTIHLPEQLDSSKAEASFKDGVLKLHVPKAEHARPKTVKVVAA